MQIKGVLFDFDGVVVDSTPTHLKGWSVAYQKLFGEELDLECLQTLVGRSTSAIARHLGERAGYPLAKEKLIEIKNSFLFDNIAEITAISGISDFMCALNSSGIPYGIVSNAPKYFIDKTLQVLSLDVPFFLGIEDYSRPKPDAEPYMKGAARFSGVKFTDHPSVLVFEDSTHGIEAALAAHMTAIGICSQHEPAILRAAGAKETFNDFTEAVVLLKG